MLNPEERVHSLVAKALARHLSNKEAVAFVRSRLDCEEWQWITRLDIEGRIAILLQREKQKQEQEQQRQRSRSNEPAKQRPRIDVEKPKRGRRRGQDSVARLSIFMATTELGKPLGKLTKEECCALRDRNGDREKASGKERKFYDWLQTPLPPRGLVENFHDMAEVTAYANTHHVPNLGGAMA